MCLDKRMRISAAQIAIYSATGGGGEEGIRLFFPLHHPRSCGSAARPPVVTFWPLIQGFCGAVVVRCGSGVTSLQQRQIEGTDFDNVKKEISFFPLGVARQADKMAGWSGRICFHPLTSVLFFSERLAEPRLPALMPYCSQE